MPKIVQIALLSISLIGYFATILWYIKTNPMK